MPALLEHDGERILRCALPTSNAPLHLDANGRPTGPDAAAIAIVPFTAGPRTPRRFALIATGGTPVAIGLRDISGSVAELRDGDHLFLGERELIFSTDDVPQAAADAAPGAPCPICCEPTGTEARRGLFDCPRCALRCCDTCWQHAPRRVCLTPGCGQSAALDRPPWAPARADFILAEVAT
jgi:hypothetical protein